MQPIIVPLSDAERHQLLITFNNTRQPYPQDKTVPELFEEQVRLYPDNIAIRFGNQTLTYDQLNRRVNQLAGILRQRGVQPESIVGLLAERSMEMIVGILAILKAGGAYLPLDPTSPPERLQHMLEDCAVSMLLVYRCATEKLDYHGTILDLENPALYEGEPALPPARHDPDGLVYVIYTSGTTGKPKGVLCTHKNVIRLVCNTNYVNITAEDRILQISNYVFDGSVFDIFGALLNGAELTLLRKEALKDINELAEAFLKNRITLALVPTVWFNMLVELRLDALTEIRQVMVGGEAASVRHVRQAVKTLGAGRVVNLYGPTEGGVVSTYYRIDTVEEETPSIPIGKPLANAELYILDDQKQLIPCGTAGELYVGGEGLARGYLNRPELMAERFIPNPFIEGKKIYRTGDLVRWLPDGNIEFLGRVDRQVKIRGYRIELEEIENQISQHAEVRETAVLVKERTNGTKYLCAYIGSEKEISPFELRAHLARRLPDYMVPTQWVQMESLPRTSNGKVNYGLLPQPAMVGREYEAPRSKIEQLLTEIWEQVLGISPISIGDHFFELGGQSIQVIKLAAELEKIGIHIKVEDILAYQSIKRIAESLETATAKEEKASRWDEAERLFQQEFGQPGHFITYQVLLADGTIRSYQLFHLPPELESHRTEIYRFFDQQVAPAILPHYFCSQTPAAPDRTQSIARDEFYHLLGLKPIDVNRAAQQIESSWDEAEAAQAQTLCTMEITRRYPLGPFQHMLAMVERMPTGAIFYFDHYVDRERMTDTVREIINEQGVFRCILESQKRQLVWREHQTPEQIALPFFDLSTYEPEQQQQLVNQLVRPLYEKGFPENAPLYRLALIRKNFREHLILFCADHLIYDGACEEILRRNLHEFYQAKSRGQEPVRQEIPAFADYVEQIQNSPRNITEEEIVEQFNLEAYCGYKQEIEELAVGQRIEGQKATTLRYSLTFDHPLDESRLWELSFSTYVLFLGEYFGFPEVPVRIVSYGRRYEEFNYFGTVGLFVDMIPLLVPVNAEEPQKMAEYAYEKIALTAKYWINFYKISLDSFAGQKWLLLNWLTSPETLEQSNQLILFNYLGPKDNRHPEQQVLEESALRHQERDTAVSLFFCDVQSSDKTLEFILHTTLEQDVKKLQAIMDNVTAQLIGKY